MTLLIPHMCSSVSTPTSARAGQDPFPPSVHILYLHAFPLLHFRMIYLTSLPSVLSCRCHYSVFSSFLGNSSCQSSFLLMRVGRDSPRVYDSTMVSNPIAGNRGSGANEP